MTAVLPENVATAQSSEQSPRVGLVCDYTEENWPSMDYYGDTLCAELVRLKTRASQIRPAMPRLFGSLPLVRSLSRAGLADRLMGRFVHYPRALRPQAGEFDLFHIVDHTYGHLCHELPPERVVMTCHDLDAFRCLIQPERDPRPAWFRALASRQLQGMAKAAQVICVSETVRSELLSLGLCPEQRVTVVPNGVHPSCRPDADPAADAAAEKLMGSNQVPCLLHVGSTIPRKRIDILLRVFAAVRRQYGDVRLIRAGGPFTAEQSALAQSLGVDKHITILPFLSREVLAAVYRRSALALLTSDAEGFGLPLIEAIACGTPIIASDIPVLREVGGSAVTFCEAGHVDAWSDGAIALLAERRSDPDAWEKRRAAGLQHARGFCWAESARRVLSVYMDVLNS